MILLVIPSCFAAPPQYTYKTLVAAIDSNQDSQHVQELVQGINLNGPGFKRSNKKRMPILSYAITQGREDLVEILLNAGARINAVDDFNKTPLMYGIETKNLSLIELLLTKKPNLDARGPRQRTPLHYAVFTGDPKIVKMLLNYNAKPNMKDQYKKTPLAYVKDIVKDDENIHKISTLLIEACSYID